MKNSNANPQQKIDNLNRIAKRIPSRDKIDQIRRIALFVGADDGGQDDQDFLNDIADTLDLIRQAVRGGARDISGGRHFPTI